MWLHFSISGLFFHSHHWMTWLWEFVFTTTTVRPVKHLPNWVPDNVWHDLQYTAFAVFYTLLEIRECKMCAYQSAVKGVSMWKSSVSLWTKWKMLHFWWAAAPRCFIYACALHNLPIWDIYTQTPNVWKVSIFRESVSILSQHRINGLRYQHWGNWTGIHTIAFFPSVRSWRHLKLIRSKFDQCLVWWPPGNPMEATLSSTMEESQTRNAKHK